MNKIKNYLSENPGMKKILWGVVGILFLILISLWAFNVFEKKTVVPRPVVQQPTVVTSTPVTTSEPSKSLEECKSCIDHDKKVMEEAQRISDEEIAYLKRVEKLSGKKIFNSESQKTQIITKVIRVKDKGCCTLPPKKVDQPDVSISGGNTVIRIWNPGHTQYKDFPRTKSGLMEAEQFVKLHKLQLTDPLPEASTLPD